jgi:flagellar hook-associated protein 1 FlgK
VIPFRLPGTGAGAPATMAAAIGQALSGGGYAVSAAPGGASGAVRIVASGSASLVAASASVTQVGSAADINSGKTQIPLFVDGKAGTLFTGSFEGGSQLTGFAQRISINPAVAGNAAALVGITGTGTSTGDATRPQALYDAVTTTRRTFSSASGIGGIDAPTTSSVATFVQDVIAMQGSAAAAAQDLDEGQSIALSTAQGRFASTSGVSIDQEMSNLIALQQAFTANARVLTAARDMLDTLMRI